MRKIAFIFAALLTALPLSVEARTGDDEAQLCVMSFNIRMGEGKDGTNSWQYRCPATIYMLRDQVPDVFGVQEAYSYQVSFITDNCPEYKSIGVGREDGKKAGEHMSIFYNKKTVSLIKWGTFWLSETPSKPSMGWDAACYRTATWALMKCKKTGKKFFFVNTHLDHVGRTAQHDGLALIVSRIAAMNKDNIPMVLTGDFNVTPDDPVLSDLDKMMKSARKYANNTDSLHSYNEWGRSKQIIDYIYYSGFSACPEFSTIQKKYADKPFISDHYPVKALLTF